jgi:hypothetical protein
VEIVAVRVVWSAKYRLAKLYVRKAALLVVGAGCISSTQDRRRGPAAP